MEITNGIHLVDGTNANVYIVLGDNLTVIDTGMPGQLNKILDYVKSIGKNPSDISKIVLTHCHMDHMGNAYELKKITNAKLYVHEKDAPYVTGKEKLPSPKGFTGAAMKVASTFMKMNYVEPDVLLKEGDTVDDFVVIHNPGHTPGSISLYSKERKVIFVGDELRYIDELQGPPEQFTPDMALAIKSMEKLTKIEYDIMLSGHGVPLRPDASKKVKEFYKTLIS
ncbi:MBL fold metallo-hydrolase [Athalassotoga saccharophila]|uniref:MBL fold metallo-hydrolase n=1 Tax=Athalassotoga saccharophila TaxID=1441386 RepID=UPI00137B48D2|nr:MBL fold metallo-hydrolase [Athalassotoga saccharophila]BBJ27563.1 putative metallo-hydrolase YflN [Athalassotoga saccharophila]